MYNFTLVFLFLCVFCEGLTAQFSTIVTIEEIKIIGNQKTKPRIIYRELDIEIGDTVSIKNLEKRFFETKKRLLSTGLFNLVNIYFKNYNLSTGTITLYIDVQENWYIYPTLIFELADRNFNVWWNEMNADFDRVNYGIRVDHFNLTGVKDRLKLKLQRGYTHKYEMQYTQPYLNDDQTIGLSTHLFYSDQKELPYITEFNKSLFAKADDERILLTRFRAGVQLLYRQGLFIYHSWKIEYHHNTIDSLVSKQLNPDYFLNGNQRLRFFLFEYDLEYNKTIFDIYPLDGFSLHANIRKDGFGIFNENNNISVFIEAKKHLKLREGVIFSSRIKVKTNLIRDQVSFANNTGLGYGDDIIGGYELYVLDGTDYIYAETQFKIKLFEGFYIFKSFMPIRAFKKMNTKIYFRWNTDVAYVNEKHYTQNNFFNNRWLIGYGPAIDILIFNNFLFKFEYNINHLGEKGIYIRYSNSF